MKPKVILTQKYQEAAIQQLTDAFRLVIVEDSGKNLAEILKENPDTEALISFLSDPVTREIIDLAPRLKVIANYAVGYNNIDVAYAREKRIAVTHTPDVLTEATADLTMALLLAVCRRIVESDTFLRDGKFHGWGANLLLGKELNGGAVGIVGLGRIGAAVARRAAAFGMTVTYFDRSRKPRLEEQYGYIYKPFRRLVSEADIVSLHIPSYPEVHHLFNQEVFGWMKPDAVFINVSRGNLVDEAVLADRLEKNQLFGAGLDVFEREPEVHPRLLPLNNAVLVPHIGSATYAARMGMAQLTVDNVKKVLAGQTPPNPVPGRR